MLLGVEIAFTGMRNGCSSLLAMQEFFALQQFPSQDDYIRSPQGPTSELGLSLNRRSMAETKFTPPMPDGIPIIGSIFFAIMALLTCLFTALHTAGDISQSFTVVRTFLFISIALLMISIRGKSATNPELTFYWIGSAIQLAFGASTLAFSMGYGNMVANPIPFLAGIIIALVGGLTIRFWWRWRVRRA